MRLTSLAILALLIACAGLSSVHADHLDDDDHDDYKDYQRNHTTVSNITAAQLQGVWVGYAKTPALYVVDRLGSIAALGCSRNTFSNFGNADRDNDDAGDDVDDDGSVATTSVDDDDDDADDDDDDHDESTLSTRVRIEIVNGRLNVTYGYPLRRLEGDYTYGLLLPQLDGASIVSFANNRLILSTLASVNNTACLHLDIAVDDDDSNDDDNDDDDDDNIDVSAWVTSADRYFVNATNQLQVASRCSSNFMYNGTSCRVSGAVQTSPGDDDDDDDDNDDDDDDVASGNRNVNGTSSSSNDDDGDDDDDNDDDDNDDDRRRRTLLQQTNDDDDDDDDNKLPASISARTPTQSIPRAPAPSGAAAVPTQLRFPQSVVSYMRLECIEGPCLTLRSNPRVHDDDDNDDGDD